jgi:hypothetical protein
MATLKIVPGVRYVTDAEGERTDVLVSLSTWTALLAWWQRLAEMLEDREDRALFQEWLARRAKGEASRLTRCCW